MRTRLNPCGSRLELLSVRHRDPKERRQEYIGMLRLAANRKRIKNKRRRSRVTSSYPDNYHATKTKDYRKK
ncbi:hypothetical protein NDU88_004894 [Pleurodeles waltl]|uniref:Uncharacterized protein n=1 Tax=Pleurodeles waltl TaxID=8319 RepID=A0AAV7MB83_PLEWA|nr:hypothetical protein NDU88_004894 [Pleurodeles waltl]